MTPGEGDQIELTVGPVAHGGHCVARHSGQVVFVRHALPGERVLARITELHRGHLRADAVEVLSASAERVTPPCPYARPGQCGGCDLQHVTPAAQRRWKTAVVREQLTRLAGLTPDEVTALDVRVRALPGGELGWRSRVRYTVDAAGRAGLRKHRSHEVVPVERCLIAHPAIQDLPVLAGDGRRWSDADSVQAVASTGGDTTVIGMSGGTVTSVQGPKSVREVAVGREWSLPVEAFWQVHPAAADTLVSAVLKFLDPRQGESAWDLYGGAGLFAAALAGRVGPGGRVTLVESSEPAVSAARANLGDLSQVRIVPGTVEAVLAPGPRAASRGPGAPWGKAVRRRLAGPVDTVVLDPPRAGAGRAVVRALLGCHARAVAYVACDPASFARDVRTFRDAGWRLAALDSYDLFPMTQHVECVGLLVPGGEPG